MKTHEPASKKNSSLNLTKEIEFSKKIKSTKYLHINAKSYNKQFDKTFKKENKTEAWLETSC